ncbi:hypothetical protein M413DRAFT_25714 [Hebeloma cylindrosporum]|uniref:Uncharacterized protein n=1 Tax=Hebeloma cylindrosporum TaxID=76867 RepID=A0A0C2YTF8_HEBCY|nr:hypothetical protein M413DRAFT_25714 [Hebeloma cylindrosporum h7]
MDIQTEMRVLQIGPGISVSYTILSCESSSAEDPDTDIGGIGDIFLSTSDIGNIGDIFLSPTKLQFKNHQHQWITVAEGDHIRHPIHQNCRLLLSNTGPHWGFVCQPSLTVLEAIKEHLDRIKRGDVFMPEDEDDLDDDSDHDWDDDDEEEEESKPSVLKLREQYGDYYLPDSDAATSSEPETVVTTSVVYERELTRPSWAVSNYSPEPESDYQQSMLSYHELSVDMFGDHHLEMQVIQENGRDQGVVEHQDEEEQSERAETPPPSSSSNIKPDQQRKHVSLRGDKKELTPQRARKLAARLAKEVVRLDALLMKKRKLYHKLLLHA